MIADRQLAPIIAGAPDYFHPIRDRASRQWDQLKADPDLAGPWHQLFKQVWGPRHILSELLQNEDDAGAIEAQVGDAVEMTGARLRALRDCGGITIHPATYRLVLSGASE